MKEVSEQVMTYRVKAYCTKKDCRGEMRFTGSSLLTSPPMYTHRCEVCGSSENVYKMYPIIEHIPS